MAEDTTNPFASFMGLLDKKKTTKGVIRKDGEGKDGKNKVVGTLTPGEKKRYENIFSIMKDIVNPDPEAKSIGGTAAASVGGAAVMKQAVKKTAGKGLGTAGILGALALGAAGIGAAISALMNNVETAFSDIATSVLDFGSEVASDIGNLPAMAAKLAKFLPLKKLKFIPLLGPLINFGMAWKSFKDGNIFEGLWELTSGVAGLIPGVGTAISVGMDAVKMIYEATASTDENGKQQGFGNWMVEMGKKIGTWLLEKIKAGNVPILSSWYMLGEAIGMVMSGDVKGGLKKYLYAIPAFFGIGSKQIDWAIGMFNQFMSSDTGQSIKQGFNDTTDYIGEILGGLGETVSGFFTGIYDWFMDTLDWANEKLTGWIPDWLKSKSDSEGFTPAGAGTSTGTGYGIGPNSGVITQDERNAATMRQRKAQAAGYESWWHYEKANWKWLGTEEDRLKYESINDGFISKDGKVTRFDSQDEILAAKSGGPIDKMLEANSLVMRELNNINQNQLNVLMSIRDGINILVSKAGGNLSTVNLNSNPLTQQFYTV